MSVRNCPRCGKVFVYSSSPICSKCREEEEVMFESVKKFIAENNSANLGEIVEGTGVSETKILKYIRDGRLEASPGVASEIKCEKCNTPIKSGRYCQSCALKMEDKIKRMFNKPSILNAEPPAKTGARMHITKKK